MRLKYVLIAIVCSVLTLTACSDDEKDIPTVCPGSSVPESVIKSFIQIYGDVKDVQWKFVNNYHVANFNGAPLTKSGSYTTSAWFTPEGKHCQVDQDIQFNQLPEAVKAGFDQYVKEFYPDWELDDCEIVSRIDMGLIYVIEIEKGELERELSFSENGDFLKDVLDKDEDDDDFIFPIVVPNDLKEAITALFPESNDLSFLEVEVDDDGEIEVDILDGTSHKEVKFSKSLKWIRTEYKVTMDEASALINPVVMKKLITMASAAGIDITDPLVQQKIEIEVIDHATKGLYFEVEIEIGNKEIEVIIDKDGNFTIYD